MNNVITTNTQAQVNYQLAANDIMELFDSLGFTTDKQIDPSFIRQEIVLSIQKRVEGNVVYAVAELPDEDWTNLDQKIVDEMVEELEKESKCRCDCDSCRCRTPYPPED